MKQLFATAALVLALALPVLAQTETGTRLSGWRAGAGLSSSKDRSDYPTRTNGRGRSYEVSFQYQRGRFVRDNVAKGWLVGFSGDFSRNRTFFETSPPRNGRSRLTTLNFEAGYWRRYYLPSSEPIRFFAQTQLTGRYAPAKGVIRYDDQEDTYLQTKVGAIGFGVNVGAALFLKKGWTLEAQATLASTSLSHDFDRGQTDFGLQGDLFTGPFRLQLTKYISGSGLPSTRLWEEQRTIYRAGERFIGGGVDIDFPVGSTTNRFTLNRGRTNLRFSTARFKTSGQSRGVGFSLGYQNTVQLLGQARIPQRQKDYSVGISPFREYYWPLSSGRWSVVVNAALDFTYSLTSRPDAPRTPSFENLPRTLHQLNLTLAARPGIQYQLAPRWALVTFLGEAAFGSVNAQFRLNEYRENTNESLGSLRLVPTPVLNLNSFGLSLRYFPGRTETSPSE